MNPYSKAIAALISAAVGGIGAAMLDGTLSQNELIAAAGAAFIAFAGVWASPPNSPLSSNTP